MTTVIILAAALLPPILLLAYIMGRDPQPEPRSWLMRAVACGVAICVPIMLVEYVVNTTLFGPDGEPTSLVGAAMQAFCVAALPEEGFKLGALWLLLRKNPYYDEHFDGIVYAVCISLGFAAIENVSYLFLYADQWPQVAISRAVLAVPAHYAFAVLMGYYYSLYHFVCPTQRVKACILLVPVAAHGIYDTLALGSNVSPLLATAGSMLLILFCIRMHKLALQKIEGLLQRDRQ